MVFASCNSEYGMGKDDREICLMVQDFAKLQAPKGMRLIGIGQGVNHDTEKYNYIGINLSKEKIENIAEARKLLVTTIIECLDFINKRKSIQEYLDVHPFSIQNVEVSIGVAESKPGEMEFVFNCENRLCYYVTNIDPIILQAVKIHEESFEEAIEILKKEGSLPQNFDGHAFMPSQSTE